MLNNELFDYNTAFSRNIGWVSKEEQLQLKNKRVAIGGMGGVGGSHLIVLTRLGIGGFNIADLDTFEVANFNRQYGATISTLGKQKVETMDEFIRGINPELNNKVFSHGITEDNLTEFLNGVDIYVDSFGM